MHCVYRLRRFIRHDMLDRLAESTSRPKDCEEYRLHCATPSLTLCPPAYALYNTSASTAEMVHRGLRAHIGAHGEEPIGLLFHAEMFFARQGGLTNYEVHKLLHPMLAQAESLTDVSTHRSYGRPPQTPQRHSVSSPH